MKQTHKDKPHLLGVKTIVICVAFLLVIGLLAFSVQHYYQRTGQTGAQEFFCAGEECFVTMHIHTEVEFDLCGEDFDLGREVGALETDHTHKEHNKIHWHAPLPADSETMQVTNWSKLTLENSFGAFDKTLNSTCFEQWCTGQMCNGQVAKLAIVVNGVERVEKEQYVWKDEDQILIKLK